MINKKLILKQLLRLSILLLTFKSVAQEVIGNIYSDSIPVQNVNILNKNSSKRTISDGDGKFVIKTIHWRYLDFLPCRNGHRRKKN